MSRKKPTPRDEPDEDLVDVINQVIRDRRTKKRQNYYDRPNDNPACVICYWYAPIDTYDEAETWEWVITSWREAFGDESNRSIDRTESVLIIW